MKKKICLVADVPNWAFDKIAQKLKKSLSYKYDITIKYFNRRDEQDNFFEFIEDNNNFDLIHFFNRRTLLLMETDIFKQKVESSNKDLEEYIKEKSNIFSTSVCDHIDLDEKGIKELKGIYNKYTRMYYTCSKRLYDIYCKIEDFKNPETTIHDICDEEFFKPINIERFNYENINNRHIVIGWIGNSTHSGQKEVDLKGASTIIKPVIEELINEGYSIKGHYADRNVKWRLTEEMAEYYSEIDLCICASLHEGTPLPIIESMHCGIPIITTDVGIVNEAFGEKQKEYILGSRNNGKNDEEIKRILKQKIIELYNNRNKFKELSEENIKSIQIFNGGKTLKDFENYFDKFLSTK